MLTFFNRLSFLFALTDSIPWAPPHGLPMPSMRHFHPPPELCHPMDPRSGCDCLHKMFAPETDSPLSAIAIKATPSPLPRTIEDSKFEHHCVPRVITAGISEAFTPHTALGKLHTSNGPGPGARNLGAQSVAR